MTDILNDFSDAAQTTAIEANLFEMFKALYGYLPNPVYRDEPDATWFMSDLPFMMFNGVFHARLTSDGLDARIHEIVAGFKAKNKPMVWWTGPILIMFPFFLVKWWPITTLFLALFNWKVASGLAGKVLTIIQIYLPGS